MLQDAEARKHMDALGEIGAKAEPGFNRVVSVTATEPGEMRSAR